MMDTIIWVSLGMCFPCEDAIVMKQCVWIQIRTTITENITLKTTSNYSERPSYFSPELNVNYDKIKTDKNTKGIPPTAHEFDLFAALQSHR